MLELNPEKKLAGVLAPVFAIRGADDLGIGDTEAVKELIDWAARNALAVVQILPINESGSDNSPYNLLSAIAIEPLTIATTPDALVDLREVDYARIMARHPVEGLRAGPVNYPGVRSLKTEMLEAAHDSFLGGGRETDRYREFWEFCNEQSEWLNDYAFYRSLVSWHGTESVASWPDAHRSPDSAREWLATTTATERRKFEWLVSFHAYVQWTAMVQWRGVRAHADDAGVALMGDVPVGVSLHSSDVWSEPGIFDLRRWSGAPPEKVFKSDPFTEQWGQNWGFPLYNWERMSRDNFAWWRRRLRWLMSVFHLLRVDHALGFFRIYSFPWRPEDNDRFVGLSDKDAGLITGGELPRFMDRDDETEDNRTYNMRHGEMLFRVLLEEIGAHRLIAEDLGVVPPYVRPVLQTMQIPGFKIPPWERSGDRLTPGASYERLSLATYATHDHPPVKELWNDLYNTAVGTGDKAARNAALHGMWQLVDFCGQPQFKLPVKYSPEVHDLLQRGLFACNSWLTIPMITDLFGTDERFNVPGSAAGTNWTRRLPDPIADWDVTWGRPLAALSLALDASGRKSG